MSRYYLINNHEYLCGPLSEKEIRDNMNKNNIIEGVVKVHLSNLIDNDLENFLDLISVGLTGSDLLMDISYDILDVSKEEKNMLYILVSGDASLIVGDTQVTDPLLDTSQMLTLTDDILLAIGKHAMRFQIPCEICAHYTDMEDFFSDWTALGYSRTEARKLMHGGIGEFMKLPAGAGYVRFAL